MSDKCLTTEQLERFRGKALSAAELLAVDAHLAHCDDCRRRLRAGAASPAHLSASPSGARGGAHVAFDQLAKFASGALSPVDHADIADHLDLCAVCASRLENLRSFKPVEDARPGVSRSRRRAWATAFSASGVLAACAFAWIAAVRHGPVNLEATANLQTAPAVSEAYRNPVPGAVEPSRAPVRSVKRIASTRMAAESTSPKIHAPVTVALIAKVGTAGAALPFEKAQARNYVPPATYASPAKPLPYASLQNAVSAPLYDDKAVAGNATGAERNISAAPPAPAPSVSPTAPTAPAATESFGSNSDWSSSVSANERSEAAKSATETPPSARGGVGGLAAVPPAAPTQLGQMLNSVNKPAAPNEYYVVSSIVLSGAGYEIAATSGQTIDLPFTGASPFVLDFASASGATMVVTGVGSAPVLWLPASGYIGIAGVPGARWYPLQSGSNQAAPVSISPAPSLADLLAMPWYPDMVYRGGFSKPQRGNALASGVEMPGLTVRIGEQTVTGWAAFRAYAAGRPGVQLSAQSAKPR
jgi:hypothetical protein